MGFIERAFTPPGAGGAPPGSPANPLPGAVPPAAAIAPTPPPTPAVPTAPTAPEAPKPPPQFAPGVAPAARQRAAATATMLGQAATVGEVARTAATGRQKTLLG